MLLRVHTTKKHIKFRINDKDQPIELVNINFDSIKYKMAVYNEDRNVKIKLIQFQREPCRD